MLMWSKYLHTHIDSGQKLKEYSIILPRKRKWRCSIHPLFLCTYPTPRLEEVLEPVPAALGWRWSRMSHIETNNRPHSQSNLQLIQCCQLHIKTYTSLECGSKLKLAECNQCRQTQVEHANTTPKAAHFGIEPMTLGNANKCTTTRPLETLGECVVFKALS